MSRFKYGKWIIMLFEPHQPTKESQQKRKQGIMASRQSKSGGQLDLKSVVLSKTIELGRERKNQISV
jgi:hypothetical protein